MNIKYSFAEIIQISGVWIRDSYSSNNIVCVFQEWCRTPRSLQMERGRSPWAGGALETRWALRNPWGSAVPPPLELLLWRKLATTSGRKHQVRVHLHSWTLQMNTVYLRCLQGDLLIACFVYSLTVILNIFAWRCFIFPKLRFIFPPNNFFLHSVSPRILF